MGAADSVRYGLSASEDPGTLPSNSEPPGLRGPGCQESPEKPAVGRNHTELRSRNELAAQAPTALASGPPREATKKPSYPQHQGHYVAVF